MTYNDIALIRLNGLAETVLNNHDVPVMPVCLPAPYYGSEETKVKEFVVIGWGKADENQRFEDIIKIGVGNRLPKKITLPLYDKSVCWNIFPGVDDTHICAGGERGKDSCNGDSGGPLVDKTEPMTLYGVVSAGSFQCATGQPGIYTRVDHFIDWIKNNLRD